MALPILSAIGSVLGIGKTALEGWQERKTAKVQNELALAKASTEAKIRKMAAQQEADIAWENLSIKNSGWKDEWFTILLSIPMILCFIPGMDVYVHRGFASLAQCPEWYKWAFLVAVGSSFGYKKIADFMSLKKGI
jgi:hypothetical protein